MSRVVLLGAIASAVVALTGCELGPGVKCSEGCPEGTTCDEQSGLCGISAIDWISPAADARAARSPVEVRARLRMTNPLLAPASLALRATRAGGTAQDVALQRATSGDYVGTWSPPSDGSYELSVSAEGFAPTQRTLVVDNVAPVLTVSVEENLLSFRANGSGGAELTDVDLDSWRRDEIVTVRVRASEEAAQYRIVVQGPTGNPLAEEPLTEACPGEADCFRARVDLAEPSFDVFRGKVKVTARAEDVAGNPAEATHEIPVTRLRWIRRLSETMPFPGLDAIAVGTGGVVYVPLYVPRATVAALEPDGRIRWARELTTDSTATVQAGMMVQPWRADAEAVLVGYGNAAGTSATLVAVPVDAGTPQTLCTVAGALSPQMTLVQSQEGGSRSVVAVRADGGLIGLSENGVSCIGSTAPSARPAPSAALTAASDVVFFSTATQTVGWRFDGGSWAPTMGLAVDATARSLAVDSADTLVGAGTWGTDAGALALPQGGGNAGAVSITRTAGTPFTSSMIDQAYLVFGTSAGTLVKAQPAVTTGLVTAADAGTIVTAPLVGDRELLYVATSAGWIRAYDTQLTPRWELDLGSPVSQLNFDCGRDAGKAVADRPGSLFFITREGLLYSVVVDSTRLAASPMPRWMHDPRNSGRASQPTSCP